MADGGVMLRIGLATVGIMLALSSIATAGELRMTITASGIDAGDAVGLVEGLDRNLDVLRVRQPHSAVVHIRVRERGGAVFYSDDESWYTLTVRRRHGRLAIWDPLYGWLKAGRMVYCGCAIQSR